MSAAVAGRPPLHVRARVYMGLPIPARWRDWGIKVVRRDDWAIRSALTQSAVLIVIALIVIGSLVLAGGESLGEVLRSSYGMYAMMLIPVLSSLLNRDARRRALLQSLVTGKWGFFPDTPMRWWDLPFAFAIGGAVVLLLIVFVGNP